MLSSVSNEIVIGLLFAIGSCILFGVSDFVVGEYGKKITPALILSILYVLETPFLFVALFFSRDFGTLAPNLLLFLFGSLSTAGYFVFVFGLTHGRTTIVAPLSALLALILPSMYSFISGDTVSALVLAGMIVSAIAITLITREVQPEFAQQKIEQRKIVKYSVMSGVLSGIGFGFGLTGLGVVDSPLLMKVFLIGLPGFFAGSYWIVKNKPDFRPIKKTFRFIFDN